MESTQCIDNLMISGLRDPRLSSPRWGHYDVVFLGKVFLMLWETGLGCTTCTVLPVPIHFGGERQYESKLSCLRTQHDVTGWGSTDPDCLIQRQVH